jgi:hypothetical protein
LFGEAVRFASSRELDPYREKVAEEMLLCEIMITRQQALYQDWPPGFSGGTREDVAQQSYEKLIALGRQLPTDCLDIQCYVLKAPIEYLRESGRADEAMSCAKMYNRIQEERGLH